MGNSQSRPSLEAWAQKKEHLEHLRAIQNDADGEDYVHVEAQKQRSQVNEKAVATSGLRQPGSLSISDADHWQKVMLKDPKSRLAISALSTANPRDVLTSRTALVADQQVFNVKIPFEGGPITNQRSSGRCWLFASTNVFRVALMQKYELDSFELSQVHLFFWDKLEKANWFLEQILSTLNEPLDGRLMQRLLGEPLSDGGQWDMVHNLVEKYGLVPQVLYPDSFNARSSSVLNSLIFTKLREFALTLRSMAQGSDSASIEETVTTMEAAKTKMVRQIQTILITTLGPPPAVGDEFTWEFVDRAGRARCVRTTPKAFARDIYTRQFGVAASDVAGMVSLVDDPRNPAMWPLEVERLGNVVGGRGVRYTNVDMATIKRACVAQLRAGIPVFFGCDVGKFSGRDAGVMDTELIDYALGFGRLPGDMHAMDKQARLEAGESAMTHAMVLTAVHVDEKTDETIRWRVQNSWGEGAGSAGWFVMTDKWMDEFVYQAVIDSRFLSKQVRDVAKRDPVRLPLWDPMGSLA